MPQGLDKSSCSVPVVIAAVAIFLFAVIAEQLIVRMRLAAFWEGDLEANLHKLVFVVRIHTLRRPEVLFEIEQQLFRGLLRG